MTPEQAIKALARQTQNLTCPNCGTYSKYGFSTVCIKYNTFICNACKSAHQAISHRCKSLTMSTWSTSEIVALGSPRLGGNDRARLIYLSPKAGCPSIGTGGRPCDGSDINIFKRFIVEVYEHGRYYNEQEENGEEEEEIEELEEEMEEDSVHKCNCDEIKRYLLEYK